MPTVAPDTRLRLSAAELSGLAFSGGPATVSVTDLATGDSEDVEAGEGGALDVPCPSVPRLLRATWLAGGAEVSAELDVVAAQVCSVEDVRSWRSDEYEIRASDEELFEARARAVGVIEAEMGRPLQPVMRMGVIDRPNCTGSPQMVMGEGGYADSLMRVVSARMGDGRPVSLPRRPGSARLDVRALRVGEMAEVAYVCGMPVPPEARDAVRALAAWYLTPHATPDNATSTSSDVGTFSIVVAGVSGAATSLPEVNALIRRHGRAGGDVG